MVSLSGELQHFLNPPNEEMKRCQHTWEKQRLCFFSFWYFTENTLEISGCLEKLIICTWNTQFHQYVPSPWKPTSPGGSWSDANIKSGAPAQGQMCGHLNDSSSVLPHLLDPALPSPWVEIQSSKFWFLIISSSHGALLRSSGTSSQSNPGDGFACLVIPEKSLLPGPSPNGAVPSV